MLFYDKYTIKQEDVTQLRLNWLCLKLSLSCLKRGWGSGDVAYCSDHDTVKCALAGASQALFCSATGWFAGKLLSQHTVGKPNFTPRFVLLIWHMSMHLDFPSPNLLVMIETSTSLWFSEHIFAVTEHWHINGASLSFFLLSTKPEVNFLKIRFLTAMFSYGLQKCMACFAKEERLLR